MKILAVPAISAATTSSIGGTTVMPFSTTLPKPSTVPAEPTTPMKLSEAIRLGSLVTLPGRGRYLFYGEGAQWSACAMGAAAYAHGARSNTEARIWSIRALRTAQNACPVQACAVHGRGMSTIGHLNDDHRWTRERIADWLAEAGA